MSQAARIISTIILKAKFLPVINGKNIEVDTNSGKNGTMKMPVKTTYFNQFNDFASARIVSNITLSKKKI